MLPDEVASGYKTPGCAIKPFPRSQQTVKEIIQVLQAAQQQAAQDKNQGNNKGNAQPVEA